MTFEASPAYHRRRLQDRIVRGLCLLAAAAAVYPLLAVLGYVASRGMSAINWDFFTKTPAPVGDTGGGMANAILGTVYIVALACYVAIPVGVITGVFLAESPGASRFARVVRFASDVLAGAPSIVVGLFAYAVVVVPMGRPSAYAGGFALSVVMIPIITRTTEELVRMVPDTLREAALALGVPRWRATVFVVLRSAASGILTGVMLSVARAMGETAPLLFTALGNEFWNIALDQPMASMPVQIYRYASSPYEEWHAMAWAGALVLVVLVLILNIVARLVIRRPESGR
ncbi:MAG: phosphate ABC transporter permease PstA [Myxococcales bacterium]|nr:phosphate ABC transporter permease PstA [Myxococcales bacterium]